MIRKVAIVLWLCVISCGVIAYVMRPDLFAPQSIAELLLRFQSEAMAVYFVLSVLRGFTLLPSTPLVIAGTLLFPASPVSVLVISLIGIVVSSTFIYWFSELLGFAEFFETRKPTAVERIRRRLEHPAGVFFVFLWAFFPLVPTDAVCYVAGSTRMSFWKFISAVFLGELILCSVYVFGGGQLMRRL